MASIAKKAHVSELSGAALDWAVAVCKNLEIHPPQKDMKIAVRNVEWEPWWVFTPSTNWAQGGPIIEREKIGVGYTTEGGETWLAAMSDDPVYISGATALIAAMRCYCCSKLGDTVDVPEELA
jgi:hypothetical protein